MDGLMLGVGGAIVAYVGENAGELLTQEALKGLIQMLITRLTPEQVRCLTQWGDRLRGKLPEANPFDQPELVAKMLEGEAPEVVAAAQAVAAQMPSVTIENWKGINTKGSGNTISGNTLHIS